LSFVNSLDAIDRVVVGVDTVIQLNEVVFAVDGVLESLPAFKPLKDDRLINPACWNQL
jgi:hypothetical protein